MVELEERTGRMIERIKAAGIVSDEIVNELGDYFSSHTCDDSCGGRLGHEAWQLAYSVLHPYLNEDTKIVTRDQAIGLALLEAAQAVRQELNPDARPSFERVVDIRTVVGEGDDARVEITGKAIILPSSSHPLKTRLVDPDVTSRAAVKRRVKPGGRRHDTVTWAIIQQLASGGLSAEEIAHFCGESHETPPDESAITRVRNFMRTPEETDTTTFIPVGEPQRKSRGRPKSKPT